MTFIHDNGILGLVAGTEVSNGSKSLPSPGPGQPATMQSEVEAGHHGRVRITYELASSTHHKSTHWYWRAVFAEVVKQAR